MNPDRVSDNVLQLDTVTSVGHAPKTRLQNAKVARELASGLLHDSRERAWRDTKLAGCRDGNAPFPAGELRKNGQAWRSNFNPRQMQALLRAALTPYYDLFNSSAFLAHVILDYADPSTQDIGEKWSQIVTEEFDYLLHSYEGFEFNMQAMLHDFLFFGKGFLLWPDNRDWQFIHVPQNRVLVPDQTEAFSGKLDVIVVRELFTEVTLWNHIKDEDTARDAGWNPTEVVRAIQSATTDTQDASWDYQYYQQKMRDHDVSYSTTTPVVKLAHIYVREFSNKVTHVIVPEEMLAHYKNGTILHSDEESFLFKRVEEFDKFSSLVSTFFLEIMDGSWNGITGLGLDAYAMVQVMDRLLNAAADNAFLRSQIILQATSGAAQNKPQIQFAGGITFLPADYNVQQSTIFGDMNGLVLADQTLSEKLAINTGVYRQPLAERKKGNPPTARGEELRYQSQAVLSNSQVGRFYVQLDRHYTELYRRVVNETPYNDESAEMAKKFREACKRRGVPLKALKNVKCVKAFRALGNGSHIMRQEITERLSGVAPMFPETGRIKWLKDFVALHANQTTAERYVPEQAITALPTDHQWDAMQENAAIKVGGAGAVTWTPTQNNVIHLQTHLLAASQAPQTIQQGASPVDVVGFMDAIGQHCAVHLDKLSSDPLHKQEFELLQEQWEKLGQITDQMQAKIDKAAKDQARQQAEAMAAQQQAQAIEAGVDPQTQIEAAKAKNKMQIDTAKAAQQMRNKQLKFQQDQAIKDAKAAAEISQPPPEPS